MDWKIYIQYSEWSEKNIQHSEWTEKNIQYSE
jgi:hypothetical protein